ncbi:MAG: thrombospondin type 3 repeat-containing protein, partial [Candidatus Binatia bacterium]
DECERDCDGDGTTDTCEVLAGATDCNANQIPDECEPDFDGDLLIDGCDPDIDNDGVPNDADLCDFTTPGAPIQPQGHVRGDYDANCAVDLADFAVLGDCMLADGPEFEAGRICRFSFDINLDFFVDMHDVALFWNLFEGTSGNRVSATDAVDR